ncbi:ribosome biogenesis protein WDR12 homolog [Augochlora pura]
MSIVKTISIKLGPFIKHGNGDEYLPMQMTVDGDSIVWINKELKKCEDHTYCYEFSYRDGKREVAAPQPTSSGTSALVKDLEENVQKLSIEEDPDQGLVIAKPPYVPEKSAYMSKSRSASSGKKQKIKVQKTLRHNDVVSSMAVHDEWILTGCRGGTVHVWTMNGKHRLLIPGHRGSVEDVKWISVSKDAARFVSVSKDETTMIWDWNIADHSVKNTRCKHEALGIYSWFGRVCLNHDKTVMACGGWDAMVKFYSIPPGEDDRCGEAAAADKEIKMTKMMKGHMSVVTGIAWPEKNELVTCSVDDTIKVWDYETDVVKQEFNDQEAFYTLDYTPLTRSVLAATYDQIRLYDLRTGVGGLFKFFPHPLEPLRSVKWSTVDENKFILGGGKMQIWDIRKSETPLYELRGNVEEVLCCDWSNPKNMLFGGEDCVVRIYDSPREILCNN